MNVRRLHLSALFALWASHSGCAADGGSLPHASPSVAQPRLSVPQPLDLRAIATEVISGDTPTARLLTKRRAAVRTLPTRADGWVRLGRAWVRHARASGDPGFHLNADAAAKVALALAPGHASALDLRGLVLLNDHRFAEARDLARGVLAKDPDNAMALGTLSDALLELGDLDGASDAADRMLARKPDLPSYSRAAWLMWLRGDVERAKETWRHAYDAGRGQADPEPIAWVVVQAAELFRREGDTAGAVAGADLALSLVADFPPALVSKARALLASGRPAEAVPLAERALARQPLAETAWVLADARRATGDEAGAARAEADVVRLGRRGDKRTLADFLATRDRDPAEALRLIEAERATRGDLYTDAVYALALFRNGRLEEARAAMDRALRHGTPDPRLRAKAAVVRTTEEG